MDAHTIYTIAAHAHSTTGANNAERRRLARRAQLGELVRIAPGYYLDTEAITAHSEPPVIVALARLLALQHKHPHLIRVRPDRRMAPGPATSAPAPAPRHHDLGPAPAPNPTSEDSLGPTPYPGGHGAPTPAARRTITGDESLRRGHHGRDARGYDH